VRGCTIQVVPARLRPASVCRGVTQLYLAYVLLVMGPVYDDGRSANPVENAEQALTVRALWGLLCAASVDCVAGMLCW
jgi:hypothetical protein